MTNPPAAASYNPRYIALLVAAALLILFGGAVLRPKTEPVTAVPSNELATLPERSQRRALDEMVGFVQERAVAAGASVTYLPERGSSAVVLAADSIVGAPPRPEHPSLLLVLVRRVPTVGLRPAPHQMRPDTVVSRWGIVAARDSAGRLLTQVGWVGSKVSVRCGTLELREVTFGAPLPPAFVGGGLFDLDGNALALAIPCDGRMALLPIADVLQQLRRQAAPDARLWVRLGLSLRPRDSTAADASSGLEVAATVIGGAADRVGIWPGDTIVSVAGATVRTAEDVASLAERASGQLTWQRVPGGVALSLPADTAPPAAATAQPPVRGVVLRAVPPAAARAGLEVGDRIVSVGGRRAPTTSTADRALRAGGSYVIYERDGRRVGVRLE